jgi:hypothetical protein
VISTADLPNARNSGPDSTVKAKESAIFGDFGLDDGARPDDAHVPQENVEELRQLIEARPSQEAPKGSDAGVALKFVIARPFYGGGRVRHQMVCEDPIAIDVHASEFIKHEGGPVAADAALDKNDRSAALEAYGDCEHDEGGRQKDNSRQGDSEIYRSPKTSQSRT